MKKPLCILMLFFALFAFSQTARAQEFVYSVSHVQQFGDPSVPGSVMAGYSGTGMTYGIAAWYNAIHVSTLERDGVIVDQQVWENYPSVFNETVAPLVLGGIYNQYTDSALRIVFPYVCGVWYDAFGFTSYGYLPYEDNNQWPPFPAICVAVQIIYLGYTVAQDQGKPTNTPCVDTCTPCKADRRNRIIGCSAIATACETAAFIAYDNALNNCNFQAFCDPANPAFNQAQCDNCRSTARNTFIAQTAVCGAAATNCYLTLPDCYLKDSCPQGPNGPKGQCK